MDTAMPIVTYTYDPKGKLTSITKNGVTEKADGTSALEWKSYEEKPMDPQSLVVTHTYDANWKLRSVLRPDGTVETFDSPGEILTETPKEPEGD